MINIEEISEILLCRGNFCTKIKVLREAALKAEAVDDQTAVIAEIPLFDKKDIFNYPRPDPENLNLIIPGKYSIDKLYHIVTLMFSCYVLAYCDHIRYVGCVSCKMRAEKARLAI